VNDTRDEGLERAARIAHAIGERLDGRTVATAESITAGLLAQAFAAAEGSQPWFRGGVVAYQRDTKQRLFDVDDEPLVTGVVARKMARGAARLLDAQVTIAVTGAAGPEPLDGAPPGSVVVAVAIDDDVRCFEHRFAGEPPEVCAAARDAALADLLATLSAVEPSPSPELA
jgi:nicotinamide-nucleotide amidase